MVSSPIGHRIRARRKEVGLTQTALAKMLGVSVSYVNLIEHDKRSIGGALLNRMAEVLGLDRDVLDGAYERRVLDELAEAVSGMARDAPEPESARDLLARHEPWARALIALHRASLRDQGTISALSGRLDQDPVLSASVGDMLASATAIRSVADILAGTGDIDAGQRQRFDTIVHEEAIRLSEVARTLAEAFEVAQTDVSGLSAPEEVDDFLYRRSNHFPELEEFAERIGLDAGSDARYFAARLEERHDIALHRVRPDAVQGDMPRRSAWNRQANRLDVAEGLPTATLRFELARLLASIEGNDVIAGILDETPELSSGAARRRAERALAAYGAGAMIMPYTPFLEATEALRYDTDALAIRFGTSTEQTFHRFTTLRRPGEEGVPFAMLRANAAGHLTKRFPLPRLPMPRHGGACPLWAVYLAIQMPDVPVARIVEFPNRERFFMLARAARRQTGAHNRLRPVHSLMLACEIVHADRLIYSDGLDLDSRAPADPVGSTCALCPRTACNHRQETAIRIKAC